MAASYTVEITTTALTEAKEANEWLSSQSEDAAQSFRESFIETISSLSQSPFRCMLAPEDKFFSEEIRQILFMSYRVMFTVEGEKVFVLHVRHQSQRYLRED